VTIEEPPQAADPDAYAVSGKTELELGERDVALLLQHRHDLPGVGVPSSTNAGHRQAFRQPRVHAPPRKLVPADRARHTHSKPRRSTAMAQAPVNRRDDPITQILR